MIPAATHKNRSSRQAAPRCIQVTPRWECLRQVRRNGRAALTQSTREYGYRCELQTSIVLQACLLLLRPHPMRQAAPPGGALRILALTTSKPSLLTICACAVDVHWSAPALVGPESAVVTAEIRAEALACRTLQSWGRRRRRRRRRRICGSRSCGSRCGSWCCGSGGGD